MENKHNGIKNGKYNIRKNTTEKIASKQLTVYATTQGLLKDSERKYEETLHAQMAL